MDRILAALAVLPRSIGQPRINNEKTGLPDGAGVLNKKSGLKGKNNSKDNWQYGMICGETNMKTKIKIGWTGVMKK